MIETKPVKAINRESTPKLSTKTTSANTSNGTHGRRVRLPRIVQYPETDGEPMADSEYQYDAMTDSKYAVSNFFQNDPMVYVAANMFIYLEKGHPNKNVAPDLFVIKGVTKRKRSSYKTWLEGRLPNIVFEIASPGTYLKDFERKTTYLNLRIPEYIMLDPYDGNYFGEPLQGYRLARTAQGRYSYEPMPLLPGDDQDRIAGLYSHELNLEIWAKRGPVDDAPIIFRFRDPSTGEWLLSQTEGEQARQVAQRRAEQATQRVEQEHQARLAAEAEVARLRALLSAKES